MSVNYRLGWCKGPITTAAGAVGFRSIAPALLQISLQNSFAALPREANPQIKTYPLKSMFYRITPVKQVLRHVLTPMLRHVARHFDLHTITTSIEDVQGFVVKFKKR